MNYYCKTYNRSEVCQFLPAVYIAIDRASPGSIWPNTWRSQAD